MSGQPHPTADVPAKFYENPEEGGAGKASLRKHHTELELLQLEGWMSG